MDLISYVLRDNNAELVFKSKSLVSKIPSLTVVMPVFNQEEIIAENLISVVKNASIPFDLIILVDFFQLVKKRFLLRICSSDRYL